MQNITNETKDNDTGKIKIKINNMHRISTNIFHINCKNKNKNSQSWSTKGKQ